MVDGWEAAGWRDREGCGMSGLNGGELGQLSEFIDRLQEAAADLGIVFVLDFAVEIDGKSVRIETQYETEDPDSWYLAVAL